MSNYATIGSERELVKILDSAGTVKGVYALECPLDALSTDTYFCAERVGFRVFNNKKIYESGHEGDEDYLIYDQSWYQVSVKEGSSPVEYEWAKVQDGQSIDIIDDLNSDKTDAALSAKQGKILKEMMASFKILVVSTLPADPEEHVMYWLETADAGIYEQWQLIDGVLTKTGTINVGLDNFYKKVEVNALPDNTTLEFDTTTNKFKIKSFGVDTAQIKNGAITAVKLNDMGATDGQILIYDTTNGWEAKDYEGAETDDITVKKNASDKLEVNPGKGLVKGTTALDLDASTTFFDFASNKLTIKDSAIDTTQIKDGAITKTKLNSAVVDNVTIGLDATSGLKIKDGGVDTTQLKNGSVTKQKLNANVVDNVTLAINDVNGNLEVKDAGVTTDKLENNAVVKNKIAATVVDDTTIGFNQVDGFFIKNKGVDTAQIKDYAVTGNKLNDMGAAQDNVLQYDAINGWQPQEIRGKITGVIDSTDAKIVTFTSTKYIGGTDSYMLDIFCADASKYITSQTISSNTLTVTFNKTLTSGTTVVCYAYKY